MSAPTQNTHSLRFAANLSLLYPELPFLQRFAAAAADGFQAIEIQFQYKPPRQEQIQPEPR